MSGRTNWNDLKHKSSVVNLAEHRLRRDGYTEVSNIASVHCDGCDEWKAEVFTFVPGIGLRCPECAPEVQA